VEAVVGAVSTTAAVEGARILLVASPARGGIARHVVSLLTELPPAGYRVRVACEPDGPIARAAEDNGIHRYCLFPSARTGLARVALSGVRLARAAADFDAQIIHTHSFGAGFAGALAAPLSPTARLLATIHNYPPAAQGMRLARVHHRWAMGMLLRRASRLITVSEALRRDLIALSPSAAERTITIPNGVDTQAEVTGSTAHIRAGLGLPQERPVVGMIARLAPQKGIATFIRAAALLADGHPEVVLILAGDGPLRDEACALRRELALENRLHLCQEVVSSRELIAALDILVVASTSEGSSVVAMEAMSAGKPVVATAVGGVPEVVADGQTGLLVEPEDPKALAAAVRSLLDDPERAREFGDQGRRRAAQLFDLRLMLERTRAVYADLIREQIPPRGEQT